MDRLLNRACGGLAALALFAIMALTLVDVTGRKLASRSLPGALELTEILMVVVIFAALPLVSRQGEHVVFDSLDRLWGPRVLRAQRFVVDLLCAAALLGLAWLMWGKAGQMLQFGDTTAQLQLKLGYFVYLMSALCAATAGVHLVLAFKPVEHHHPGV
jgi:TRAP-type transport system small permease protein